MAVVFEHYVPVLVDIYAEPLVSQLCTVHPINKPSISIPRMRIKATTTSYDGTTETSRYIPSSTDLIRANEMSVNVTPGGNYNIYSGASFTQKTHKVNRRYSLLTQINIEETPEGASPAQTHTIEVSYRPDARDQISRQFTFVDSTGATVIGQVVGHINNDTGGVNIQVNFEVGDSTSTFECTQATFKFRFRPVSGNNGRTKVSVETELIDCFIDPNEDFILDLEQETIQDFSAIYNIDLLKTISEAIKRQISLNKDYDIVYMLKAHEAEMASFGAKFTVDLDNFKGDSNYKPTTPIDVFKAIIPHISTLAGVIKSNYQMYPSFIVAGTKTAAMLRSLQDMMITLPGSQGELGFSGQTAQFMKMKVLEAACADENKLYLSVKPSSGNLQHSALIDLVYNPLYIIKEVTDGATIQYVRSRTMVELARCDGIGVIEVLNIDNYLANV